MKLKQPDILSLLTVKTFAMQNAVTPSYIYKLAKEHKMELVSIDGVQFVDTKKHPTLPTRQ